AGLEDRLHPSHVHRGGAESRQIGRPGAGGAAHRIEQRPTTRATFACRGSKRERGGGGVRARGGNGTTWPDDVRAPRRTPVRSIDGSVSRPPRPGVKFRG